MILVQLSAFDISPSQVSKQLRIWLKEWVEENRERIIPVLTARELVALDQLLLNLSVNESAVLFFPGDDARLLFGMLSYGDATRPRFGLSDHIEKKLIALINEVIERETT